MAKPKNILNFTKKGLTALPAAEEGRRSVYFDEQVKNLNLMVTDKGAKSFYVRKVIKGQSKRVRLGAFPDLSVENARDLAIQVKTAIALGGDPHKVQQEAKAEPTFRKFFYEEYIEKYAKIYKRTYTYDLDFFKRHIDPAIGSKRLSAIENEDLRNLHHKIGVKAPYAANRTLEIVRVVFNKAIEWGNFKGENPARFVKPFKEKSRDRFIQKDELPCFFEALKEELNQDLSDYIWLSLLTGARKMNILSMRWSEVNFKRKEWRIPRTKNDDSQTIPLVDKALGILEARKKEQAKKASLFVFPSESGTTGHIIEPKRGWKRLRRAATIKLWEQDKSAKKFLTEAKKALGEEGYTTNMLYEKSIQIAEQKDKKLPVGMVDVRLHDLRRTLGSYQAALGVGFHIIGKSLGHKSHSATQVYARLDLDPVRDAMTRATDLMNALGKVS